MVNGATKLRKFLFDNNILHKIVELYGVFDDAIVEPVIVIFEKKHPASEILTSLCIPRNVKPSLDFISYADKHEYTQDRLKLNNDYIFNYRLNNLDDEIIEKIKKFPFLESMFNVTTGTKPYQKGKGKPPQTKQIVDEKPFNKKEQEDSTWLPYMCGATMHRFTNTWKFDATYIKYGEWLAEPRFIEGEKIIIRQTGDSLIATIDTGYVNNNTLHSITKRFDGQVSLYYLLGLLNSSLLEWYFKKQNFLEVGKVYAEVKGNHIKQLPIAIGDRQQINEIESTVKQLLDLCQQRFDNRYDFVNYITNRFKPRKITEKIKCFNMYDFSSLCKELSNQKCGLSLGDESDMLKLYSNTLNEINRLNKSINCYADKLNFHVFKAYSLTDEYINIIKNEISIQY